MKMIWGKRRFKWATYEPYQDLLGKLQLANAARYREFVMFSVEVKVGIEDIYVGVPTNEMMSMFDGFEPVSEEAIPKVVDTLLLADANAFRQRFQFRHETER